MNFEHINPVAHNVTFLYPLKYGKTSLCCDFSVYRNITFGTNRLSTLNPHLTARFYKFGSVRPFALPSDSSHELF